MVKLSVFEYKSYKQFILDWMARAPLQGRGLRKQLSEAVGCQMAFVTHVLSGDYHFSLEQGEACGRWMGLDDNEGDFFLLLISFDRAGTQGLKKLLRRQISTKREQQAQLKKRVNITETVSLEDQLVYYSSWHYAALHMALMNPTMATLEGLQKHFHLPATRVMHVVEFLVSRGFVGKDKDRLKVLKPVLHLEVSSPLLTQHHNHWRLKALDSIGSKNQENLHYSGVISLSREDYEWVRERLSLLLKDVVSKLANSPDEELACLNFDWFQI